MWAYSVFVAALPLAAAHVPFFAAVSVQLDPATSQAYYFKRASARFAGHVVAPRNRLPAGSLVEIVVREPSKCSVSVACDDRVHTVDTDVACSQKCEPFTQSSYCAVFRRSAMRCSRHFSATGNCTVPWSLVLGKKETFTARELMSFSLYASRIHGSWWNEAYIAGIVDVFVIVGLSVAFLYWRLRRHSLITTGDWLTVTAIAVSFGWLIAKLYHALFTCDGDAMAVIIALLEVPFSAIAAAQCAYYSIRRGERWHVSAVVGLASVGSVFFLGVGHVVGNAALFGASVAYALNAAKQKHK